ncbi:hypothetical protein ACQP2E_12050 [Actinoplanes sp. CA-015351]|uniref:hypothetical protein n=1 Tax=Actinoplanes sp. CA-015351 TaxID=3239897 RepID=UPI003D98D4A2
MNRRAELLERAAESYAKAGLPLDAGRCYAEAGLVLKAAQSFENAGDREAAADAYRRCGAADAAASILIELGRPDDAVTCHEQVGDLLSAGWVLALHTGRTAQAQVLLTDAAPATDAGRLRRELGLALCAVRLRGDAGALAAVVQRCAVALPAITPDQMRADLRDWTVQAADQAGRHDLAAQIFAAAYHARTPNTVARWRGWAAVALGDTFGVPDQPLPHVD